jgi:hypothetical protein
MEQKQLKAALSKGKEIDHLKEDMQSDQIIHEIHQSHLLYFLADACYTFCHLETASGKITSQEITRGEIHQG